MVLATWQEKDAKQVLANCSLANQLWVLLTLPCPLDSLKVALTTYIGHNSQWLRCFDTAVEMYEVTKVNARHVVSHNAPTLGNASLAQQQKQLNVSHSQQCSLENNHTKYTK